MVLDGELLKKAQAAGAALADAEHQVRLARADYHTTIRRLHLAGATLREVAQALALSHQRVQQIVEGAGGTWWQRIWRTRNATRDAVCSFCERSPREVAKLIAGPDVFICDGCVAGGERSLATGERVGALAPAREGTRGRCGFCGRPRARDRPLVTGPAANVCAECLRLCRQILDDRAP